MRRLTFVLVLVLAVSVGALEIYGPRALGMGGAQVALVDDGTCVYWNPGAFGRGDNIFEASPVWGFAVADNITEAMNKFEDTFGDNRELPTDPAQYETFFNGVLTDVENSLDGFNEPGVGVIGNMHAGVTAKIGSIGFSWVDITKIEVGPWADTRRIRLIPINYLDSQAEIYALHAAGELTAAQYNLLGSQGWRTIIGDGIGMDDNQSVISIDGFAQHDIAASYGYSWRLGNRRSGDFIGVGGSAKFILGERFRNSIDLVKAGQLDPANLVTGPNWLFENVFGIDSTTSGYGFSMDIGVQGQVGEFFHFGILGRNLIPFEIKWQDGSTPTRIDPMVRIGVAFEPFTGLNLAIDIDALEKDYTVSVYNPVTQREEDIVVDKVRDLSVGVEWDIAEIFAIRAGINTNYNSLIEDKARANFLATFGFGINVVGVLQFDLAVMTNQFSAGEHNSTLGGSASLGISL